MLTGIAVLVGKGARNQQFSDWSAFLLWKNLTGAKERGPDVSPWTVHRGKLFAEDGEFSLFL